MQTTGTTSRPRAFQLLAGGRGPHRVNRAKCIRFSVRLAPIADKILACVMGRPTQTTAAPINYPCSISASLVRKQRDLVASYRTINKRRFSETILRLFSALAG